MESLGFTGVFAVVPSFRRSTIKVPKHTKKQKQLSFLILTDTSIYHLIITINYCIINTVHHGISLHRYIITPLLPNKPRLTVSLMGLLLD